MLDKILTWLETKLYEENYYEADEERMRLRAKVLTLEEEICFLRGLLERRVIRYHSRRG